MASNLVSLLILGSIGTYAFSLSLNEWTYSTLAPAISNHTKFCNLINDELPNVTDVHLLNYYVNAINKLCKPEVRAKAEAVMKCVRSDSFIKSTFAKCKLATLAGPDCSVQVKGLNCILDSAGDRCGGKEAVVLTAFRMEFALVVRVGVELNDCSVVGLRNRQKIKWAFNSTPHLHPKLATTWTSTAAPTTQIPSESELDGYCEFLQSMVNESSDPEYFQRGLSQIICDGKRTRKSVDESLECLLRLERNPEYNATCELFNSDSELYCESEPKSLKCLKGPFGKHCGGQPAIDVYAFWIEYMADVLYTILQKMGGERPKCLDKFLASLRALQTPRSG